MRLSLSNLPAYNPFLSFPRKGSLKSLHISRTKKSQFDNDRLLQLFEPPELLDPAAGSARLRMKDCLLSLEECTFEHLYLDQSKAAAAAHALCVLCPKLKVLNIRDCHACIPLFLQHFSGCTNSDSPQLRELHYQSSHICLAHFKAIATFVSLEVLDLKEDANMTVPYGRLIWPARFMDISQGLQIALPQMPHLKSLGVPDLDLLSQCDGLVESLESLNVGTVSDLRKLFNVLSLKINSPSLRQIHVDRLEVRKQRSPDSVKAASESFAMGLAELSDLCISAYEIADLRARYCVPLFEPLAGTSFLRAIKCVKVNGGGRFLTIESVAALSSIASLEELHFLDCYIGSSVADCLGKGISGLHQLRQLSFTFSEECPIDGELGEQAHAICMSAQSDPLQTHHLHVSFWADVFEDVPLPLYHADQNVYGVFRSLEESWKRTMSEIETKVSLHTEVCAL